MKKVYSSNDQVMHLFANKAQSEANTKHVFFRENSIFSYGYHYELGRHTIFNGKPVVLINSSHFSKTTQKHTRQLTQACDHLTTIECSDLRYNAEADIYASLVDEQNDHIETLFDIFKRKKFYTDLTFDEYAARSYEKFNQKVKLLNCPELIIDYKSMIPLINDHIAYRNYRNNSPEMLKKKQEKYIKKHENEISNWRNGGALTNAVRNLTPQIIRIRDNILETSRGATVNLECVKELVTMVKNKTPIEGFKIDNFNVTKIENDIITIGCHTFNVDQCLKVLGGL